MPKSGRVEPRRVLRLLVVAALLGSVLAPVGVASAAAQSETVMGDAFVVSLHDDGSATVTLREAFDLTTDTERSTFRELERNETRTERLLASFEQRLTAVSTAAADDTDRSMAVENATVSITTDGDTGVVSVSVDWTRLAAVDGDRLVVSTPFDADFDPSRAVVVHAPAGYTLSATGAAPDSITAGSATWDANTSLSGFSVTAVPGDAATATDTATATGSSGPGFGVLTAIAALSALVAVRLRADRR